MNTGKVVVSRFSRSIFLSVPSDNLSCKLPDNLSCRLPRNSFNVMHNFTKSTAIEIIDCDGSPKFYSGLDSFHMC